MNTTTATKRPIPMQEASVAQLPAIATVQPPPAAPGPKAYPPKMAKAVLTVMRAIGAIQKDGFNDFHKYKYQKWDDILDRVSPLLAEHGLIVTPSEVNRSLFESEQLMSITYQFTIVNEDGDVWPDRPVITAIARARDAKGICDDKAANKCHTSAEKYFLIHFFKIKTSEPDSDADGSQVAETKQITAPVDPAKPLAIPVQGKTFASWTEAYLTAIKGATVEALAEWAKINTASLDKVKGGAPDEYAKIVKATTPPPAAAPAPSNDDGLDPPEFRRRAPPEKMPNPADNITAWAKWLDTKLAAITDGEVLEIYWNDKIAPTVDQLFPMDQESAMGIYRRHEERLAP